MPGYSELKDAISLDLDLGYTKPKTYKTKYYCIGL